jgi:peptidoglycan/xylan/chitin deacetylase (PgdA/CDA1 family)
MESCPFQIKNLNSEDVVGLTTKEFEIGTHTVNHVDLGQCRLEIAETEVSQSQQDLEMIIGKPVKLFSYPYGGKNNIRGEVTELIQRAGYEALFSAYGGHVNGNSNPFDLPRLGVDSEFRPIDLLMEIEGLSLGALKRALKRYN